MNTHHCHTPGCTVPTSPTKLMCSAHWAKVPPALRMPVIKHYRRGQCADKQPSKVWLLAACKARRFVAELEGRQGSVVHLDSVIEHLEKQLVASVP